MDREFKLEILNGLAKGYKEDEVIEVLQISKEEFEEATSDEELNKLFSSDEVGKGN